MISPATWERTARAFTHPLQLRILQVAESQEEVAPVALAEQLDEKLANVSYHVKVLLKKGMLIETRTMPVRGAVAHFYRLNPGQEMPDA